MTEQKEIERKRNGMSYAIQAVCRNCEWSGELRILKGIRVSEANCPKCKCNTVILDYNKPTL
jgi:hypothetical protein